MGNGFRWCRYSGQKGPGGDGQGRPRRGPVRSVLRRPAPGLKLKRRKSTGGCQLLPRGFRADIPRVDPLRWVNARAVAHG